MCTGLRLSFDHCQAACMAEPSAQTESVSSALVTNVRRWVSFRQPSPACARSFCRERQPTVAGKLSCTTVLSRLKPIRPGPGAAAVAHARCAANASTCDDDLDFGSRACPTSICEWCHIELRSRGKRCAIAVDVLRLVANARRSCDRRCDRAQAQQKQNKLARLGGWASACLL
jgi:hypothetical protein